MCLRAADLILTLPTRKVLFNNSGEVRAFVFSQSAEREWKCDSKPRLLDMTVRIF